MRRADGEQNGLWRTVAACWFTWFGVAFACAAGSDFESANELYDAGKFAEAKPRYERLVDAKEWSANLFYNLANCDLRLGSPGRAILNYERALALDPSQPEARANLALVRGKIGAKVRAPSWQDAVFSDRRGDVWSVVAAVSGWLALFLLAAILTSRAPGKQRLWLGAAASAVVCAFAVAVLWHGADERNVAIVTAHQTDARLAPAETAGVAESLPAGSRVRVLGERGEWSYCALPGEGRGWIARDAVERVRLGST